MMKKYVAIVEDNYFLTKSVQEKLSFFSDIAIAFTANNGAQCLAKLAEHKKPHVILMDIEMPCMNGIEATAMVKQKYPQIKIIILTVFDDDEKIFKAIQAGADGYLLKETDPDDLYAAIQQTLEGGAAMTPSIALKTLNLLRFPLPLTTDETDETIELTTREIEVLEQLSTGIPYTSIAENLFISPNTVRRHIENIYQKLQVHTKTEALNIARKKRLL